MVISENLLDKVITSTDINVHFNSKLVILVKDSFIYKQIIYILNRI
jgi:hypothetical protein